MEHKGTKRIETERLILRPLTMDDVSPAFRNFESDERVTEYLRWQAYKNIEGVKEIFSQWVGEYENKAFYQWAIELKELGEPIGCISVVDQDEKTDKVHIGYCLGVNWWHQGITSEAFKAIIPFLFDEVKANRIEAQHDPNNPHSGNVMKKCGLKYEGTMRQADWSNKGIVDAAMYALLREDWKG